VAVSSIILSTLTFSHISVFISYLNMYIQLQSASVSLCSSIPHVRTLLPYFTIGCIILDIPQFIRPWISSRTLFCCCCCCSGHSTLFLWNTFSSRRQLSTVNRIRNWSGHMQQQTMEDNQSQSCIQREGPNLCCVVAFCVALQGVITISIIKFQKMSDSALPSPDIVWNIATCTSNNGAFLK
jgi:hypothetical protein